MVAKGVGTFNMGHLPPSSEILFYKQSSCFTYFSSQKFHQANLDLGRT